ncbi:Uncharacterised protein [Neisseria meningitidis]|nr:Uncharacterised protein [Neisseria meningitidis]
MGVKAELFRTDEQCAACACGCAALNGQAAQSAIGGAVGVERGGEHDAFADKQGGIKVGRLSVQFVRACSLEDAPLFHHGNPVGVLQGFFAVVADENGRFAVGAQGGNHVFANLAAQLFVQRAEGFVQQNQFGIGCEGAGEGDALLLSARKFVRIASGKFGNAGQFQHSFDALPLLRRLAFAVAQPVGGVAVNGQVGEQHTFLYDITQTAFADGEVGIFREDGSAGKRNFAKIGLFKTGKAA